ncbi:hypothetical protein [Achromobacter xylosoxidans]|uniref:hypothetical protein n=1 Tax=Alcaligenes xylosoxydans xylosoxydans TaxID=85698 RepID=UPI00156587E1|nr:hypothetical protein [Achromobacter xylosoxidans]QKI69218.1 hypothetical protein HPS44_06045 [Achromobacter xylosoxidans]
MNSTQSPARQRALSGIKKKFIHKRMQDVVASIAIEANGLFGGEPYRIKYRVSIARPKAYYEAAQEAVVVLLNRQELLVGKVADMLAELDRKVKQRLGKDAAITSSYWYKPLTDVQLDQIAPLLAAYPFNKKAHNQLNLIADLLRVGPRVQGVAGGTSRGGDTPMGRVDFISRKSVSLFGEIRAIRWRAGKPYVRDGQGAESNLFAVLQGAGVEQATAARWLENGDQHAKMLERRLGAVAQYRLDVALLEQRAGPIFDPDPLEAAKGRAAAQCDFSQS